MRFIRQPVLNTDHVKVMKYRIESVDEHFATLSDGHGDSNGCSSDYDPNANLVPEIAEAAELIAGPERSIRWKSSGALIGGRSVSSIVI